MSARAFAVPAMSALLWAAACGGPARDEGLGEPTGMPAADTGSTGSVTATGPNGGDPKLDVAPGATGGGPGDVDTGCEKIDFLFVVDNSSSMDNEQADLVGAFPGFISEIQSQVQGQDHHIMVVDSDADPSFACEPAVHDGDPAWNHCPGFEPRCSAACPSWPEFCVGYSCGAHLDVLDEEDRTLGCGVTGPYGGKASNEDCGLAGDRRWMTADQPDLVGTFSCAARVGISGHWFEAPVSALRRAISPELTGPGGCNEGFLRDDALLVVVLITDDDQQAEGPDEVMYGHGGTPEQWYEEIVSRKTDPDHVILLGIVATETPPTPLCEHGNGIYTAPKFVELIEQFGTLGLVGDTCDEDWPALFHEAVGLIDQACDDFVPPG